MVWNRRDLTGQSFGRLTATAVGKSIAVSGTTIGTWQCRCECGSAVTVPTGNLTSGNTQSCGCRNRDAIRARNTARQREYVFTPTWRSWSSMRRRCLTPGATQYPQYGGRGITIDPRWGSFESFLADMGERPEGTSLDRIDPDRDYTPDNCRWADPKTQSNNRRNNRTLTYDGRTQTIAQWAREVGLSRGVLFNRITILGWDVERALNTPTRR